jgi:hypothetical protein
VLVDVIVVVSVVGDGDELEDASSGRADGHEPICTRIGSAREKTGVLGVNPFDSPRALRAFRRRARDHNAIGPSSTSTGTGVSTV